MSLAATPPTRSGHSRQWYIVVFSLVGIVGLGAIFGGLHWYAGYAHGYQPTISRPNLTEKATAAEEKKAEKAAAKASPTTQSDADTAQKVGSHKPTAKPTSTPGA
jgi:hypothetical protein